MGRIKVERKEVKKRIREAIDEVKKEIGEGSKNRRGWWDEEYRYKKKELRKELRE